VVGNGRQPSKSNKLSPIIEAMKTDVEKLDTLKFLWLTCMGES
jgi:hypothetical protein